MNIECCSQHYHNMNTNPQTNIHTYIGWGFQRHNPSLRSNSLTMASKRTLKLLNYQPAEVFSFAGFDLSHCHHSLCGCMCVCSSSFHIPTTLSSSPTPLAFLHLPSRKKQQEKLFHGYENYFQVKSVTPVSRRRRHTI